jgi:magnesium transporter
MKEGRIKKRGISPGSLIFTGNKKVDKVKITVIDYDAHSFKEIEVDNINDLSIFRDNNKVSWLNITGLHDPNIIEKVGEIFKIHPLTLEDILNVNHSPKMDNYDDYIFVISKMIDLTEVKLLNIEQVSFILGNNYLITFQEDEEDVFRNIRERLRGNIGRIRKGRADYLMYRLLDAIVDNYFIVLDNLDERIERFEDKLFATPEKTVISSIHFLRKELMKLRRSVIPLRDTIYSLEKERDRFIEKSTYYFIKDLYDHLKQFVDSIESHREAINGIMEVYLSNASHKMNEVIKLLTIISTIFIPLTFIVGIYGMNFNTEVSKWNMPELNWVYGYPAIMLIMLFISLSLVFYFKKKKWF